MVPKRTVHRQAVILVVVVTLLVRQQRQRHHPLVTLCDGFSIADTRTIRTSRPIGSRSCASKNDVATYGSILTTSRLFESSSTNTRETATRPDNNEMSPVWDDIRDIASSVSQAASTLWQRESSASVLAQKIVQICDDIDQLLLLENPNMENGSTTISISSDNYAVISRRLSSAVSLWVRRRALEYQRYELLVQLMQLDYTNYITTASWLSPSRISRLDLPNVQDVPYTTTTMAIPSSTLLPGVNGSAKNTDDNDILGNNKRDPIRTVVLDENGEPLVPDCAISDMKYEESLLDKLLLSIFRRLVTKHTGGVTSTVPGILGLLEQGRTFMTQPNQTPEAQHEMVQKTLGDLMTPVLPPFYRIFMSGIVPNIGSKELDGKQLGPWFYAPILTSYVTPTFFGFLVGPSYPNRRKDGNYGGLVVEKCKFLQESNCKGLCLHQCKIPAQQFFADTLGLPLTVTPNFVTQECQWSFGETPVPVSQDPSFPKGCISGCMSRQIVRDTYRGNNNDNSANANLCN